MANLQIQERVVLKILTVGGAYAAPAPRRYFLVPTRKYPKKLPTCSFVHIKSKLNYRRANSLYICLYAFIFLSACRSDSVRLVAVSITFDCSLRQRSVQLQKLFLQFATIPPFMNFVCLHTVKVLSPYSPIALSPFKTTLSYFCKLTIVR